jgi:polyferredoxin
MLSRLLSKASSLKVRASTLRVLTQIAFVAIISNISIRHMLYGNGPGGSMSIHSYCPLGGFETLFTLISSGNFLAKTTPFNLTLFIVIVVSVFLFGRSFCGWVCPFGSVIEWLGRLGRKASFDVKNIPPTVDRLLRSAKYLILALIVFGTYSTGRMVFAEYDPYPALFHFGVWTEVSSAAIVILALTLISSVFVERGWCRYACPLGAITAIFAKFSIPKVATNSSTCVGCRTCSDNKCTMGIKKHQLENNNLECVMCLRCVEDCKPGSIKIARPIMISQATKVVRQHILGNIKRINVKGKRA